MNNTNEHPDLLGQAVECTSPLTGEIRWIPITKDLGSIQDVWLDTLLQQIHEKPKDRPIWIADTCAHKLKKTQGVSVSDGTLLYALAVRELQHDNPQEGMRLMHGAAYSFRLEDPDAMLFVGEVCLMGGFGEGKDEAAALYWYDAAAGKGSEKAAGRRDSIYRRYKSRGIAVPLLKRIIKACHDGSAQIPRDRHMREHWETVLELSGYLENFPDARRCALRFDTGKHESLLYFESGNSLCHPVQTALDGAKYTLGGRKYTDIESLRAEKISVLAENTRENISLWKDIHGRDVLISHIPIPVFDSGDSTWDSWEKYFLISDGDAVHAVYARGGFYIGTINVYENLLLAKGSIRPYLKQLGYQTKQIRWML